jgi:hypothetical protein
VSVLSQQCTPGEFDPIISIVSVSGARPDCWISAERRCQLDCLREPSALLRNRILRCYVTEPRP